MLFRSYSVTRVEGLAGNNPTITALLQLNGHDRFQVREGRYFNEVDRKSVVLSMRDKLHVPEGWCCSGWRANE